MKTFIFCLLTLLSPLVASSETSVNDERALRFFSVSGESADSPASLLKGLPFTVNRDSRLLKISLVFEQPQALKRIQFESCSGEWRDGIEFFSAPGLRRAFVEGGREKLDIEVAEEPTQALAIVFGREERICLKNFRLIGKDGRTIAFGTTKVEVDEVQKTKRIGELRKIFAGTALDRVIEGDLQTTGEEKRWIFRFRVDGTFFIRGFTEDLKQASAFSTVGTFEAVRESKDKIRIKLSGYRFTSGFPWDGISCPYACKTQDLGQNLMLVSDTLLLEKVSGGSIMVRNREPAEKMKLAFVSLKTQSTSQPQ